MTFRLFAFISHIIASALFPAQLYSQKLPNVQMAGLAPPTNLRIDGKMNDWNNKFMAFNKNVSLSYSLANDEKFLYLAVQADDVTVIKKILAGGVTFIINTKEKKEKDAISITFPFITAEQERNMGKLRGESVRSMKEDWGNDLKKQVRILDSISYLNNRVFIDRLKEIKVEGISQMSDNIISIYNEQGILARALFDKDGNFNYELAVPLAYIPQPANQRIISYSIKLLGTTANNLPRAPLTLIGPPPPPGPGSAELIL